MTISSYTKCFILSHSELNNLFSTSVPHRIHIHSFLQPENFVTSFSRRFSSVPRSLENWFNQSIYSREQNEVPRELSKSEVIFQCQSTLNPGKMLLINGGDSSVDRGRFFKRNDGSTCHSLQPP